MRGGVVIAGEQPLRIHRKFVHECAKDVDEEHRVDQRVVIVDQGPELCRTNEERGRKGVKRLERLPRDDVSDSPDDRFVDRLVRRLRQEALRAGSKAGTAANSTAN